MGSQDAIGPRQLLRKVASGTPVGTDAEIMWPLGLLGDQRLVLGCTQPERNRGLEHGYGTWQ